MRIAMSPAAAGLLRSILARAAVDRDRILLTEFRSTDWQSLTFVGERHEFQLRVTGPDAGAIASNVIGGLDESEFDIPGNLVANIALVGDPACGPDGSLTIAIEALTVRAD
jgi:hypothetical protein